MSGQSPLDLGGHVAKVFDVLKMEKLLGVYDSEKEALQAFE